MLNFRYIKPHPLIDFLSGRGFAIPLIFLSLFLTGHVFSQGIGEKGSWVGAGAGFNIYHGDIPTKDEFSNSGSYRMGIHLQVQQKLSRYLGIYGRLFQGTIANDNIPAHYRVSFETTLKSAGIGAGLHLGSIGIGKANLIPYLSIGVNFVSFDVKGDLLEDNTKTIYRYWKDGTIHPVAEESPEAATNTSTIKRDYKYETDMQSLRKYQPSSSSMPVGFGFMLQTSPRVSIGLVANYDFTRSDFIDGQTGGKGNDGFLYTSISLNFKFAGKDEDELPEVEENAGTMRIPEDLRFADKNNDGYISPAEMRLIIYQQPGETPIADEIKTHLVDFFFEQ